MLMALALTATLDRLYRQALILRARLLSDNPAAPRLKRGHVHVARIRITAIRPSRSGSRPVPVETRIRAPAARVSKFKVIRYNWLLTAVLVCGLEVLCVMHML